MEWRRPVSASARELRVIGSLLEKGFSYEEIIEATRDQSFVVRNDLQSVLSRLDKYALLYNLIFQYQILFTDYLF